MKKKILITGGAGFIGSHVDRRFVNNYPDYQIVNLDKLTYAGNLENLKDIEKQANYTFVKGDITDAKFIMDLFHEHGFDGVIHLAAESHVDRSISNPLEFVMTNVVGTVNLLNAAKSIWHNNYQDKVFYHVSTDEVYGQLGDEGKFMETTPYSPNSPYSASKASSDHFVRAYLHTYGLPVKISNCSNNYGSHHFPEKLIPLMINNIMHSKPLPVYGKGENVRDWLAVSDHCRALRLVLEKGRVGETYNVGGNNEWSNLELVRKLCQLVDELIEPPSPSENLITFVTDRPGHDLRYAIDSSKIRTELGWQPMVAGEDGFRETVRWYLDHQSWWQDILMKNSQGLQRIGTAEKKLATEHP